MLPVRIAKIIVDRLIDEFGLDHSELCSSRSGLNIYPTCTDGIIMIEVCYNLDVSIRYMACPLYEFCGNISDPDSWNSFEEHVNEIKGKLSPVRENIDAGVERPDCECISFNKVQRALSVGSI